MKKLTAILSAVLLCVCALSPAFGADRKYLTGGQTVYIPAYSHIYAGNRERPFLLTITLSIRNIDPYHSLTVFAVDYYETQGSLLKRYATSPVILKPLETLRYVVPERDESGGSGANFIVKWKSETQINAPIIESIMISTRYQQGISFTSQGREIVDTRQ